ncbi:thiol:disulfide interchange protein DsbA/DsbL [Luteimonas granuli]|uniref:Thiol:disulfide interchange protein DsbA/DsbL n=1 Tax=Luteimonas granuli TaxID=1176533 RepID=A0A518N3Q8_9GAMM|nr:thiol:disulfide interchange protein DsbA/DsbL [Luteimonas granuli]QDW66552.1 thiol:disulfide interchange protein DsbA/DsbL [Luteimonas granuli]
MNKRLTFASLLLSVLLVACGGGETPATADAPAATPAPTAGAAAPESDAVSDEPSAGDATAGDASEAAPSGDAAEAPATAATDAPAATEATPAPPADQGPPLVAGVDYVEIPGGQPFAPLEGKVEVVEVFAYSCGACAAFDPLVGAWQKRLPGDVRFTYLPAVFHDQDNYPKAYFAAEAIGVADRVHSPLFNAMHIERSLRPNSSAEDIVAWMAKQGVDAGQLRGTIDSFAVKAKVARTKQFIVRSGIDATPTLVVNGKYRVRGRTLENVLEITDRLIARERAAAAQAGGSR